ncbi:MAG: hypothetical protein MN733_20385 [Nitrososphaera sp.]|nr:hypothetical protein [Nitrososphaera sp.]
MVRHKIAVIAVVAFVAFMGMIQVKLVITYFDVAEGLAIALLIPLIMIGAIIIYYKVSGKPIPRLDHRLN